MQKKKWNGRWLQYHPLSAMSRSVTTSTQVIVGLILGGYSIPLATLTIESLVFSPYVTFSLHQAHLSLLVRGLGKQHIVDRWRDAISSAPQLLLQTTWSFSWLTAWLMLFLTDWLTWLTDWLSEWLDMLVAEWHDMLAGWLTGCARPQLALESGALREYLGCHD